MLICAVPRKPKQIIKKTKTKNHKITKLISITYESLLSMRDTHHERKKPRDTTAILTSCNCSWTSKGRYPEEAFSKEPLCISDKCITLAMEDKSHIYPKKWYS